MVPTTPVAEPISTFKAKPQHYLTLDAARGIAAITVMLFHIHKYVYPHVELAIAPQLFAHSYLAVDLFFIMSGLVVNQCPARRRI